MDTTPDPSAAALRWRMRRGMRELDMILTRWFDARYAAADADERAAFHSLLDTEDPDLWSWVMGHSEPPRGSVHALVEQLRIYR